MSQSPNLCSLPYDIRYLIYQYLFPACEQIYLHAFQNSLQMINSAADLPTSLFYVNRLLGHESAAFFYNHYLFNVVGITQHCLSSYPTFMRVLQKHTHQNVRLDAFSNGEHSATCCLSFQGGNTKAEVLEKRARGEKQSIEQLKHRVRDEQWKQVLSSLGRSWSSPKLELSLTTGICVVACCMLALAVYLAHS